MTQITKNNTIIINGKVIPECPYGKLFYNNTTVINDKIYCNGYEYKNGEWKRTLKAIFHLWF